jgi:hypothetical protein
MRDIRGPVWLLVSGVLICLFVTAVASTASAAYTWVSYGGHEYALTQNYGTWEQCESEAESVGGYLAVITDAAENAFLTDFVKDVYIPGYSGYEPSSNLAWIGLELTGSNIADPSSWSWVTGEPVTYWNPHPEFPFYDGVYMYLLGANHTNAPGKWDNNPIHETTDGYHPFGIIEAPVPEPATLIVWSLLGAFGITAGWRRWRKAA